MKNKIKNLLHEIKANSHLLIIPICVIIIVTFWTYLLFQIEVRNSLWLLISNTNPTALIILIIVVGIYNLIKKFKEFKQELFDKIEREHRNTLSFLQTRLTEEINYSTKAILLQEKLKK